LQNDNYYFPKSLNTIIMKNKRILFLLLAVAILLSIPLIAMQFSTEVYWTASDFLIAGALLLTTGLVCELVIRNVKQFKYKIAICAVVLLLLLVIWAELAVGIFGTPFSGS
jgi:ABC-type cobalt transport system substrate-binding protein